MDRFTKSFKDPNKGTIIRIIGILIFGIIACPFSNAAAQTAVEWAPWDFARPFVAAEHNITETPHDPGRIILCSAIKLYKAHISRTRDARCPMYPSCSSYALQSVIHRGLLRGVLLASDRLIRCGSDLGAYPDTTISGTRYNLDPIPENSNEETP